MNVTGGESEATTVNEEANLLAMTYDMFYLKFGLKSVAEKKLISVINTCLMNKE
jgi:hypothetical protein